MPMPHIPGRAELEGFDWQGAKVDTVGAKARPGDFVFPIEVAQENPLLMALMKATIANEGVDPESYTAGSETGNYNPLTGQQHFFLKKAAKKLKKGVKKVTKGAKKGWDKVRKSKIGGAVMNIAAPIAGFAIGGPGGAALASGAAAKATGASTKNALLMGALSGVTMGAASKFGGVSAGKGNLFQRMGNTSKGMTAWGKTGLGKASNLGGQLVKGAINRPGAAIAGAAAVGGLALAARNRGGGGGASGSPSAMGAMLASSQRNQQASMAQGQRSSSNFYNQQEAQQRQRQGAMLNQVSSMGQRAAQLPPAYPGGAPSGGEKTMQHMGPGSGLAGPPGGPMQGDQLQRMRRMFGRMKR